MSLSPFLRSILHRQVLTSPRVLLRRCGGAGSGGSASMATTTLTTTAYGTWGSAVPIRLPVRFPSGMGSRVQSILRAWLPSLATITNHTSYDRVPPPPPRQVPPTPPSPPVAAAPAMPPPTPTPNQEPPQPHRPRRGDRDAIWHRWNRAFAQQQHKQQQRKHTSAGPYHKTQLPIVLCHGLFGFDKIGPDAIPALQMHYWSGIAEALRTTDCEVYIARVPAVGDIQERAKHLNQFLEEHLANRDVNLVAHSMGGLDARYVITHLQSKKYTVRSLTTVATPHRGSPVMDWIRDTVGLGVLKEAAEQSAKDPRSASLLSRIAATLDAPAYSNLTTDYMTQQFNPSCPDDPNVKYYSYGGAASISPFSPVRLLWEIVRKQEGENDGVVSVYSARWGDYLQTVCADHFDLNKKRRIMVDFKKFVALYERLRVPDLSIPVPLPKGLVSWNLALPQFVALPVGFFPVVGSRSDATVSPSQQPPEKSKALEEYRRRLQGILDATYGPQSLDDYIYGYEDETRFTELQQSIEFAAKRNYDAADFYLSVMDRLYRQGF